MALPLLVPILRATVTGLRSTLTNVAKSSVVQGSKENLKRAVLKRTKVKRERIVRDKLLEDRRLDMLRKREKEEMIESKNLNKLNKGQNNALTDGALGFLGRIMKFLGYLLVGWLIYNLPTIIQGVTNLIKRIQSLFRVLVSFKDNLIRVLEKTNQLLQAHIDNMKSFDFFDISNRVKNATKELNQALGDLKTDFDEGFELLETPLGKGPGEAPPMPTGTVYSEDRKVAILQASQEIGLKPEELAGIIAAESSGGDPGATNPVTGRTGLIQFGPDEAKELGTTFEELKRMNFNQQLALVVKYFKKRGFKPGMTAEQAYRTVHAGNPYGRTVDASGVDTVEYFNRKVQPTIDAYTKGGYFKNVTVPTTPPSRQPKIGDRVGGPDLPTSQLGDSITRLGGQVTFLGRSPDGQNVVEVYNKNSGVTETIKSNMEFQPNIQVGGQLSANTPIFQGKGKVDYYITPGKSEAIGKQKGATFSPDRYTTSKSTTQQAQIASQSRIAELNKVQKASEILVIDDRQAPAVLPVGGSEDQMPMIIPIGGDVNSFIKQKLLLDLAYT